MSDFTKKDTRTADGSTTTAQKTTAPPGPAKGKKRSGLRRFFRGLFYVLATLLLLAVIAAVIIITVSFLGTSSGGGTASYSVAADLNSDEKKLIDEYISAVNTTKEQSDFSLSVKTASEVKDVECSLSLFNTIINSIMKSMDLGYDSDESYTFIGGADSNGADPVSVIQPAGALIDEKSYSGISSVSGSTDGDTQTIEFTVAAESIDINEIMSLTGTADMTAEERAEIAQNGGGLMSGGFDSDEFRNTEEYSEFTALVPNHTQYFDVLSAFSSIMRSMSSGDGESGGFGIMGNSELQDNEAMQGIMGQDFEDGSFENGAESGMFSFDGGTATFGDMHITAVLQGGEIQSVSIALDFVMNLDVKLMSKSVELSYTAALSQEYLFTY